MNRQQVSQFLGGTPVTDPGAGSPVVCYTIGGCVFSELSHLAVTFYQYQFDIACAVTIVKTSEEWSFASRTSTTMTYSGAGGSATYDAGSGRWTYSITSPAYTESGGSCVLAMGPSIYDGSCSGFTYSNDIGGIVRTVITAEVHRNDCIPSVAV